MTIEEAIAAAVEAKLRPVLEELRALRTELAPTPMPHGHASEWLSPADVARELGVTAETVRAWVKRRKIKAKRVERALRIHRSDLERFLEGGDDNTETKVDALAARLKKLRVAP